MLTSLLDNLAFIGQIAFMITQYDATVDANGDVVEL
jgi:hypothetical protein